TCSFVEITWILFQKRWQYGASNKCSRDRVSIGCTEPLGITVPSLPVTGARISRLCNSRKSSDSHESKGICCWLPSKPELLARVERQRFAIVTHIKIWNEAEDALFLLLLNLILR